MSTLFADNRAQVSEENVALFLESAAAAGRDDWEAVIARMHPEIVFIPRRAPVQGSYVGHEEMRRFAADTRETFDVSAIVVDFQEGLITRFQDYSDRRLALAAVGLTD